MDNYLPMLPNDITNKNLVVKSNSLMEAKFQFKLWEMRLFEKMISLIKKGDKDFRSCKIYMKDLITYFEGNSKNDYKLIEEAALSLGDKKLFIPYESKQGSKRWAKISIFPTITIPHAEDRGGENAYIELEFHHDLKSHLLDLKERFKAYDIRNIQPLRSIYSIRIFILLKQFEVIGFRRMEVQTLKELLGVDNEQYKLYADFKKRVLLRPQKDLEEHCDIRFDFVEEKVGKKVQSIYFTIKPNEPERLKKRKKIVAQAKEKQVVIESIEEKPKLTESQLKIYIAVKEWGITEETLLEYFEKRSEEHIRACIEETKNATNVKNEAKYFISLVQKEQLVSSHKLAQNKKATKRQQAEERELLKIQFENELRQLKDEKFKKEQEVVEKLIKNEELEKQVKEQVSSNSFAQYDKALSFAENLDSKRSVKMAVHTTVTKLKEEYFKPIHVEFEQREKELKNKYR